MARQGVVTTRVTPTSTLACPVCGTAIPVDPEHATHWYPPEALGELARAHPDWRRGDGACSACLQQALLTVWLRHGDAALHSALQHVWPLDRAAAFPAIPTPLRLHADPRFTGRGVTMAFVDAGYYPHADLVRPSNRIRAWVDASRQPVVVRRFSEGEMPDWPGANTLDDGQWHGLMTTTAGAGNGYLSHGLYRGLASDAALVLIHASDDNDVIDDANIARSLEWLVEHHAEFGIRVVSVSLGGDGPEGPGRRINAAVEILVDEGVTVVVAAGNAGVRRLAPPATAPEALTVGGLDDRNDIEHRAPLLWHSSYGEAASGALKPDVVAPSIWIAAPILPGTGLAREARALFAARHEGPDTADVEREISRRQLVTPHYHHVEGTSVAAPLAASLVACLLEANPQLTPAGVRRLLVSTAHRVPGAPTERQGAGTLVAGAAIAAALAAGRGGTTPSRSKSPAQDFEVSFELLDPRASRVEVFGAWNQWTRAVVLQRAEPGVWMSTMPKPAPGRYPYKYRVNGATWMADPANPETAWDGHDGFNSLLTVS